jgi:hypothetical protein
MSGQHSLPFIKNLDEHCKARVRDMMLDDYAFCGLETGTEWLECMRRTEHLWKPRLKTNLAESMPYFS